jgi:hypothetical protein
VKSRVTCPGCGRSSVLTKAGHIHTHMGNGPGNRCPWSRRPPDPRDALALTWQSQHERERLDRLKARLVEHEREGDRLRRDIADVVRQLDAAHALEPST